jgi:zinc-ribbon domain
MYCSKCGTQSSENDVYCRKCGLPLYQEATPSSSAAVQTSAPPVTIVVQSAPVQRTSGFAVASLVLGLLGIWPLAIIFGGVGISKTKDGLNVSGRGMAVAGLVLGILVFLVEFFVVVAIIGAATG